VTKRADCFVFTKTSERALWPCDSNSWQGASQLVFIKAPLFGGSEATNEIAKNPGNTLSDALQMPRCQNLAAEASQK